MDLMRQDAGRVKSLEPSRAWNLPLFPEKRAQALPESRTRFSSRRHRFLKAERVQGSEDYEELDAAADAALSYARSLPPGAARSHAIKAAGKLRRQADELQAPKFAPRGRRPK